MKGKWIPYSPEELAWIEANASLPRSEAWSQFCRSFQRSDVSLVNFTSLCKRKKWHTGRTGRFEKGHQVVNGLAKGQHFAGCEKSWFARGVRHGKAAELYQPIGTERLGRSGYLERKINDDMPLQRRWRAVHLIRWEEIYGPVPADHCLKALDGNRLNTEPSNWELIPRAMLPRLNGRLGRGYDSAPQELKPTIMAVTRLEHAAREAKAVLAGKGPSDA